MFDWLRPRPASGGPDFSSVDSREKAEALFRRGELERLFLMPLEFGGEDTLLNTLYVPVGIAAVKVGIDRDVVGPLVADGTVTVYRATPEYQGASFIPTVIRIEATTPGQFSTTIRVWGNVRTAS